MYDFEFGSSATSFQDKASARFDAEIRLMRLINIFIDSKWSECGPLAAFRPEGEKYVTEMSLIKILDSITD